MIYAEAKADYQEFAYVLKSRGVFVTQEFLDALQKIADKKLHPVVFIQSRGFTRLWQMPYADQAKLVGNGLQVVDNGGVASRRLFEMSDEDIMQVVTTHGRVRTPDEQRVYLQQLKAVERKMTKRDRIARRVRRSSQEGVQDYVRTANGVRFTNPDKEWTLDELRRLLSAWCDGKTAAR